MTRRTIDWAALAASDQIPDLAAHDGEQFLRDLAGVRTTAPAPVEPDPAVVAAQAELRAAREAHAAAHAAVDR